MTQHLEEGYRTVSWTESRDLCVGYNDCGVCGLQTPEPTMDRMVEFARSGNGRCFMWPGNDRDSWMPPNWSYDRERGLLCPQCTQAKNDALAWRRGLHKAPVSP
jgi:hypothetical protein